MEKLKNYLLENEGTLSSIVQDINSYDGSLDYLDYWANDEEFFNTYYYNNPYEVARAINYGDYNFMDAYVHINAYGNIESISEWEYEEKLKSYIDDIIDRLVELYNENHIDVSYCDELEDILNNLEG